MVSAGALGKVLAAISELEFQPSEAARALVTRKSHTIGILSLTEIFSPASLSFELQRAAQRTGYHVSVATVTQLDENSLKGAALHSFRDVDGLIVLAPTHTGEQLLREIEFDIPIVVVEGSGTPGVSSVGIAHETGADLATSHLIEQGVSTVHHVAGPWDWPNVEKRLAGWRRALQRGGLPQPEPLSGDWSAASGYEAGRALAHQRVEAVFVANDLMALGVISGLADSGLRVPNDVLVAGFDDIAESAYLIPKLTSVHQDYRVLASSAVEQLVRLLGDETLPEQHLTLPVRLVVRQSSHPHQIRNLEE
jgi:LacI family transcriptional regulator